MTTRTAYRSTHPTVLAAWRATQEQADEIVRQRKALLDELGFTGRPVLVHGQRIIGVGHLDEHGPVPDGWRRDRDTADVIVPDRRRAAGKALAARLDALTMPDPRRDLPSCGMPEAASSAPRGRMYWPGMQLLGDAVYVTWGCDPERVEENGQVDPAVWERVRLSEYYAAVEATEAAEAGQ